MKLLLLLAAASSLRIAPAPDARFRLLVDKTGLLSGKTHIFEFSGYEGSIEFDAANPERSSVNFSVDAASIQCLDTWVNEKDRAKVLATARKEMLAIEQFPRITFQSTAVSGTGPFIVRGQLTVRGVTRPVEVNVERKAAGAWEGKAALRLTAFGLKPPSAVLGAIGTKDEMRIEFHLKAN
ncbi:MAG: YceI family protein [Acidobacteria bacterium]|nr:YceI family protein [Acidobacteriota bacterium]